MPKSRKFSDSERDVLIKVPGIGPTVVKRLEDIGIASLDALRQHDAEDVTLLISQHLNAPCWKNSPQARRAIAAAIATADEEVLQDSK